MFFVDLILILIRYFFLGAVANAQRPCCFSFFECPKEKPAEGEQPAQTEQQKEEDRAHYLVSLNVARKKAMGRSAGKLTENTIFKPMPERESARLSNGTPWVKAQLDVFQIIAQNLLGSSGTSGAADQIHMLADASLQHHRCLHCFFVVFSLSAYPSGSIEKLTLIY